MGKVAGVVGIWATGEWNLHYQSLSVFCGRPCVVLDKEEGVSEVPCPQARCPWSSGDASGAARGRRRSPSSRWTLCEERKVERLDAPASEEFGDPARAAVAVEAGRRLAHDGDVPQGGDDLGETGALGAGGYTGCETDTATAQAGDAVMVEVGVGQVERLDVLKKAMASEDLR